MSTFAFRAVDLAGVPARGEMEASSKTAVSEQLRQRGLIVLDISEKREALKLESIFQRFKSVNLRAIAVFSRQFATLIASGMPMLRSLYTLEAQTEDEMLEEGDRRRARGRRGGKLGGPGDGVAAGGVRPALPRRRACRGGLGSPRGGARPDRLPARAARRPAPAGALGDDLPGGRLRPGAGRDDRRGRGDRAGVRRASSTRSRPTTRPRTPACR